MLRPMCNWWTRPISPQMLNADGSPADITVPDLAAAIADDVEQKAHLFQRFTVAN